MEWTINANIDNKAGDIHRYPFTPNEELTKRYKEYFNNEDKYSIMAMILIANYIGYPALANHFNKYVKITDMASDMD